MTLNTFHFAGRGEMNVTLGIPRLREILMVASANIRTPSMDIPFKEGVSEKQAEKLRLLLTSVNLAQVLQYIEVSEQIDTHTQSRFYTLKFVFLEKSEFAGKFCVKPRNILSYFERKFLSQHLIPALRKVSKQKKDTGIETVKEGQGHGEGLDEDEEEPQRNIYDEQERKGMGEGHESSDEEEEPEDADATQQARRARHAEKEYDAPEDEEIIIDDEDQEEETPKSADSENADKDLEEEEQADIGSVSFRVSEDSYEARISYVTSSHEIITDYDLDRILEEWCTVSIRLPLELEKINMSSILRSVAEKAIIHQVPNITRAFLVKPQMILKTEGINILAMAEHRDVLDLSRLHCNNIHTMAQHYGIEAASRVLVKEMTDVFRAYGIVIDPRHLTLIADYMTFSGTYRPFNRIGIESSASPLQQMSFETVVTFLRDAALTGTNPSKSKSLVSSLHYFSSTAEL